MSFRIPLHFEDLTRSTAADWRVSPQSTPLADQLQYIQQVPSQLLVSHPPPTPSFISLHTLITRYTSLTKAQRIELVSFTDTLVTSTTPSNPAHVKIALYFLSGLAVTASAVTPVCKFWEKTGRESVLEAISTLLFSIPSSSSFSPSDSDQIASLLVRTVLQVLEQPTAARDKNARTVIARILIAALTIHPRQTLPAITALLHALNRHEHFPTPLADVLFRATEEQPQLTQFVSDFVCEITRIPSEDLARDHTAAKACAAFIGDLAERVPHIFRSNLALVLSQLDGDSYTMRNGVVHVIGVLIKKKPEPDDPLLDILLERAYRDINAFTRSKALQTWISLVEAKVIPNRLFPILANMAASRLDDKAAAVRKYAAQLLANLLQHNPFGPALHLSHFKSKLEGAFGGGEDKEEEEERKNESGLHLTNCQLDNADDEEWEKEGASAGDGDHSKSTVAIDESQGEAEEQEKFLGNNIEESSTEAIECEIPETVVNGQFEEQSQEALRKKYYKTAVAFIKSVEIGLTTVYDLLRSKSITDVSEAVSLLVTAVQFQLETASGSAVRKMLPLVLSRENNIRQAAVNAYVRLLAPGGLDSISGKESVLAVATGLAALGQSATTGELACLEELIKALFDTQETSKLISLSVIAVLWDIFAGKVPGASVEQRRSSCILVGLIAAQRPESLKQRVHVLESVGLPNLSFARWSCAALCKLPQGSDADGRLSRQLADLIKSSTDLSTIEQALSAIFVLSKEPEAVVGSLIRNLAQAIHNKQPAVPICDLTRFLQVVGHVAVKELVRIEALANKLRRAAAQHARHDGDHEEEEQAGAEADKALQLAEKELVSPGSLLGRYGNLAKKIASDGSAPAELQASSVLCMAKLMCVQEKFCETNLRLLFSILTSSPESLVRANAVTALGDLAFRFPNLVEPWNFRIYAALQDKNDQVRKNTLMALTHLILNDMVKVKGQIVWLAVCILDKNERIADLARLFFHELARKSSNAIYNILPDTISCMSQIESLQSEDFKKVVAFLVGLMDKERHADGMVEKLCHRFRTNESERENRDLAYCISQLSISEKGVKKLNDHFKSFSSALSDDVVYGFIMQAVNRRNKGTNGGQQNSPAVEELTSKIEAFRKATAEAAEEENTRGSLESSRRSSVAGRRSSTRNRESSRIRSRHPAHGAEGSIAEKQMRKNDREERDDDGQIIDSTEALKTSQQNISREEYGTAGRGKKVPTAKRRKRQRVTIEEDSEDDSDVESGEESSSGYSPEGKKVQSRIAQNRGKAPSYRRSTRKGRGFVREENDSEGMDCEEQSVEEVSLAAKDSEEKSGEDAENEMSGEDDLSNSEESGNVAGDREHNFGAEQNEKHGRSVRRRARGKIIVESEDEGDDSG